MDKKIEELNKKYQNLLEVSDDYNHQFIKHLQNFYLYAIEAGDGDFQKAIQATKKFKKMIDGFMESSKFANKFIVQEAFNSIVILILTLLRSTRWQDNNAGIQIIICYFESKYELKMDKISQAFKLNLTKYLEYPEELFQENTSKLLTLLMNSNNVYSKEEYLEIQNMLIQSMHSSLNLNENFQDFFQIITNKLAQHPNILLGLEYKGNFCIQDKYSSKIQLNPLLQILKEISTKTQLNNYQDVLIKCCLVNQKQTQISAFIQLTESADTDSNDIVEIVRNSLFHNNLEIRKIGTQLAIKMFNKNNYNMMQEVRLLLFLNQALEPLENEIKDQITKLFNLEAEQGKKLMKENFILIANLCSLQVYGEDEFVKMSSWRNLYRLISNLDNSQEIQLITQPLISLISLFSVNDKQLKLFYYWLYFIKILVDNLSAQDQNSKQQLLNTLCKFIGKFSDNKNIQTLMSQIFIKLDMTEDSLRQFLLKQYKLSNSQESQIFWQEFNQVYQENMKKQGDKK